MIVFSVGSGFIPDRDLRWGIKPYPTRISHYFIFNDAFFKRIKSCLTSMLYNARQP